MGTRQCRPGIRATKFGDTNLLVTNMEMARDLAAALGPRPVALMRGHGAVVAGTSLREVVFNAVYLELNADLQMKAHALGDDHVPQRRRSARDPEHSRVVHLRAGVGALVPARRPPVRRPSDGRPARRRVNGPGSFFEDTRSGENEPGPVSSKD